MTDYILKCENLNKYYGEFKALDNFNFELLSHQIVGLMGPNGSGKTTLINCLLDNLTFEGKIEWKQGKTFYYLPDENNLPDYISGYEYIGVVLNLNQKKVRDYEDTIDYLCNLLDMQDDVEHLMLSYSYGMKKKIQLIAAFTLNPDVLILDEIFRGLDLESSHIIKRLLRYYVQSKGTVLLSSHDILVVEQICDELIFIVKGELKLQGSPADIQKKYKNKDLEEVFYELIGDKQNVRSIFND